MYPVRTEIQKWRNGASIDMALNTEQKYGCNIFNIPVLGDINKYS